MNHYERIEQRAGNPSARIELAVNTVAISCYLPRRATVYAASHAKFNPAPLQIADSREIVGGTDGALDVNPQLSAYAGATEAASAKLNSLRCILLKRKAEAGREKERYWFYALVTTSDNKPGNFSPSKGAAALLIEADDFSRARYKQAQP